MSAVIDLAKKRAQRSGTGALRRRRKEACRASNEEALISANPSPARAAFYEQQAADVRAKAEDMINEEVRSAMLRLATVWDALAQKAKMDMPKCAAEPF